ncbi:MAG: bacillithiol biosynthesis cysteine-adding enzyme BshC [Terriglobia bacterium]
MESHCIPFTEIPHTTALFTDFLYRFSRVAAFYAYDPFNPASFSAAAAKISLEASRRSALADVLGEQNQHFGADRETQANIARLGEGRALAVVTGQQAGLFGGPAYSVYKALTAIRLAEKLTAEGMPAVPVFWLASEDHDFAEVNHCFLLDPQNQPLALYDNSAPAENTPIGELAFDASIETLREQVKRLWPRDGVAEAESLLAGYTPGVSYAHAFARFFQRLFAGRGLVVLDPLHPTLHALSRPLFRRALEEAHNLHAALRNRDRELKRAGYHAQVRLRENGTLLFVTIDSQRWPLRRRANGFVLPGQREQPLPALLAELEAAPERFSANVLLRPVVQDWLLPTVAYVAGPNELCYLAQASVLYDSLLGRMPVVVPRASLTLVDAKVRRLLGKYRLTLADLFCGPAQVRARLAERHLPARLVGQLRAGESKIEKLLAEVAREVKKLDPTLAGATETSRRKMLYQFNKIRRKAAGAQAERKEIIDRHLGILFNALYPAHGLQERQVNFLSFVARSGPDLVSRLLEQPYFPGRDHQVIFL